MTSFLLYVVKRAKRKGDIRITVSNETILVLIVFKVRGNLRFLSHAEMIKVFQRACVRGGIEVLYTEGFNPRMKLSLPLPRSVGIEVDDDLLCLQIENSAGAQKYSRQDDLRQDVSDLCTSVKTKLLEQLPDGFELLTVRTAKAKASVQPRQATYLLAVRKKYLDEKLKTRIKSLLASESLNLQRRIGPENSKFKSVDVRPFLELVELDNKGVIVECKISLAGSIRVDEILELLELDYDMLSAPIRRTRVKWQVSES